MELYPRRLTDAEHVQRVARGLRFRQLFRWPLAALLAAALVGQCWMACVIQRMLFDLAQAANADLDARPQLAGFLIGASLGIGLGFTCIGTVHSLMHTLINPRSERLLVQHFRDGAR